MVEWAALRHAYGSAEDVPGHLAALRSPDDDERREAFGELYASITHQGNRYSASAAAVPPLLGLVADPATPDRDLLLYLLGLIAVGSDEMWLPGGVDTALLSEDEARAYAAVGAGLPVLHRLAASGDAEVAASAAYLLSWYPGERTSLEILRDRDTPADVVAIGLLGLPEGVAVAEAALRDGRELMRWAGAIALAALSGRARGAQTVPSSSDRVARDELLRWAASDRPRDRTVPFLEGDLAGYALLSLPLIGVDPLEPALSRLRRVGAEPALTAVGVALRAAFPDGPVPDGTPYRHLGERQRLLIDALAGTPGCWLHDGAEFANVSLLVSGYGLPHGRERLAAYAGRTTEP
ncbi:hypothetical protein Ade02nite_82160 [Paractinoplanes deccanensis]|uniref:HEAT repeat domain-containing protein n=1 Tax=Paractinoplanes deccanensis TaxID=113561 RepID=A0ABQ3YIF4_9ACTN|nr:hypothetical protein [Actinoplanes deccanensis]GID79575.1 hypothetical protein Ade02nite_82160 [Actinoplanes deccanensis]